MGPVVHLYKNRGHTLQAEDIHQRVYAIATGVYGVSFKNPEGVRHIPPYILHFFTASLNGARCRMKPPLWGYSNKISLILSCLQLNKKHIQVLFVYNVKYFLNLFLRLLEVNGHLVIGKDSSEVSQILNNSRPVCRIVFLRPLSAYQLLKSNGCKETSNLRHELTSVVSRLNHKMQENAKLKEQSMR